MAQSGLRVSEKLNRIHRGRVESKEQRKPEHKGSLTTCLCGGRSYRDPVEYYNLEFRFLSIGTYYQVCIVARQCYNSK